MIGPCRNCRLGIQRPAQLCAACSKAAATTNGEVSLWLPFPPSVNNLFSQGIVKRKIRRFPSKQYKAWRKEAVIRILAAKLPRFTAPVVIKLQLTPKDSRTRDADNYNKPVIDALVEARVLQGDDSRHVKAVVAWWENPSASSGVRVFIRPAKMEGKQDALNGTEQRVLANLQRKGPRLVTPAWKGPGKTLQSLIEKGRVEVLPGLIPNAPQGYRASPAD